MKFEVEVISEEFIKPSTPTPENLRHYKLSFLDQLAPPIYMPMVLFFPKEPDCPLTTQQRRNRITKSLSDTLTLYHPLAGRVKEDDLCVVCNDQGAYLVEAKANCDLSDILNNPNPNEFNKFLALELDDSRVKELPVAVQITFFKCDGMTISLLMNHKVVDALSFFMFLNTWAAVARGDSDITPPVYGAADIFPPKNLSGYSTNIGIVKKNLVIKRLVFEADKIAELRDKYADKTSLEFQRKPTRVEALSAFIWHRLMTATQPKGENDTRIFTVLHAVNLRTRIEPPLPLNYFGNVSRIAVSVPSLEQKDGSYTVVTQVRDSIKQINPEFVKKLQQGEAHLNYLKQRLQQFTTGEMVSFSFTSLCRFPIYDADFGWGKPAFVGSVRLTYKNLVSFFDTKSGDGIEAWINLLEEDMAKFEADKELLSYVSPMTNSPVY
ncbi:hypothetical protein UlMin_040088 [Ulmus minor]